MSQQPDFSQHFHRDKWIPLRYGAREGPQFRHDIAYLSGYLHDACIATAEIKVGDDGLIRLPLERVTWETAEHARATRGVAATLTIGRVIELRWKRRLSGAETEHLPASLPSVITIRYIDTWMTLSSEDLFCPVIRIWAVESAELELELRSPVEFTVEDDER